MAIDLGQALLQKDYNQELRDATEHYRKKGKAQGLWGQIGGYGGQALASALLSATLGPAGMALAGGLANTLGTYAGGLLGGAQYGDYDAKFGQETIGELDTALDDSLLTSAITSGIQGGASSYKAGLGAGEEVVGKVTEEAIQSKLSETMSNIDIKDLSLEHSILGTDPTTWDTIISANLADGTREELSSSLKATLLRGDPLPERFTDASFIANVNGTGFDFDLYKESLDMLELGQTAGVGREYLDNFLQAESMRNVGLDPYSTVGTHPSGAPMSLIDAEFSGLDLEGRLDYLKNAYRTTAEQTIRENAALHGLDFNEQGVADYLVDDPADLGPETFGKRWQDIQAMGGLFGGGWGKSGGFEGLLGGENFGFHFEPQPDVVGFDPVTQQFTSTPAKSQNMDPLQWAKNNPWKTLGGAGLLWTLLNQD